MTPTTTCPACEGVGAVRYAKAGGVWNAAQGIHEHAESSIHCDACAGSGTVPAPLRLYCLSDLLSGAPGVLIESPATPDALASAVLARADRAGLALPYDHLTRLSAQAAGEGYAEWGGWELSEVPA